MKIDTVKLEQLIYYNISKNFSRWAEKQLLEYEGILKYLGSITYDKLFNTKNKDIYNEYVKYCKDNNYSYHSRNIFSMSMRDLGYSTKEISINGKRLDVYRPNIESKDLK